MPGHDPYRADLQHPTGAPLALVGDAAPAYRVPDGTVDEIVAYIEDAPSAADRAGRARAVLDVEQTRRRPRKGVVAAAEAALSGEG